MSNEYFIHSYDSYIIDPVKDIGKLIDLAHKNDTVKICFSPECPDISSIPHKGTKIIKLLEDICQRNNWPKSKFEIISGNPVEKKCWPYMSYVIWSGGFLSIQNKKNFICPKKVEKLFGCFICNSSWPRLWISAYLNEKYNNQTDQTFLRSLSNPSHAISLDIDNLIFNFSKEHVVDELDLLMIVKFLKKIPLIHKNDPRDINGIHPGIDLPDSKNKDAVSDNILSFYENIFVDIVCETFFSGSTFYPTEKTARSLVTRTPFIIMGPTHFLTNLKKLGFKTFSKYWDESYDWLSGAQRVLAIGKLIDEIAKWDQNKIDSTMNDMKTILDYNYNLYMSFTDTLYKQKITQNLQHLVSTNS